MYIKIKSNAKYYFWVIVDIDFRFKTCSERMADEADGARIPVD